ncbi:MAG: glycosyl hydrolase [Bacteroidota bacterium]
MPSPLPNSCRMLQIIPPFEDWAGTTDDGIRGRIRDLKNTGLGGLVTNVSLKNYLRDETSWQILRRGVQIAHEEGLRVWIYDEEGYPSAAAGGLVLEREPSVEAQGLIRVVEADGSVRYDVITLYDATHATENFYKKRHYPNILDPRAVATFLNVTHDHYARVLEPIDKYVEAFFTDEPSLISAYIPKDRDYPQTLPWHSRVPEEFLSRKGYDLLPHRDSLFVDTGEIDRKIRCDFYEVIADLCAETYFGGLQEWCRNHHVASSGHLLGEETMVWQTDFDGDPFTCYRKFDIPGIDMILSDPEKIMAKDYFMVPKIAGSATRLQGKRRLMCEISDFFGMMDKRPATTEQMKCTAGILFSCGVTDLCSYYPLSFAPPHELKEMDIPPGEYKKYAEFVARLNAMFTGGTIASRVAVLYPLTSIWSHFTPSHRSMYEPHPNEDVRALDESFTRLCRTLLQQQIDYDIVDERSMATAEVKNKGLVLGQRRYEVVLLPPIDTVRLSTMEVIGRFAEAGGSVMAHERLPRYAADGPDADHRITDTVKKLRAAGSLVGSAPGSPPIGYLVRARVPAVCELTPASPDIVCATIGRNEGPAIFLTNVSPAVYAGRGVFRAEGTTTIFDPSTGEGHGVRHERTTDGLADVSLNLRPYESIFIQIT